MSFRRFLCAYSSLPPRAISRALLSKSLDMMETTGEKMVEMLDAAAMERSVNPNVGGNIDISI